MKEKLFKFKWIAVEAVSMIAIYCFINYIYVTYAMPTAFSDILLKCFLCIVFAIYIALGRYINKPIVGIILALFALYFVSQEIYYRGFGSYYRFALAVSLYKEVAGESKSVMDLIESRDYTPFIILGAGLLVSMLLTYIKAGKVNHWIIHLGLRFVVAMALIIPIFNWIDQYNVMVAETQAGIDEFSIYQSDYYIYNTIPTTTQFVNTFGLGTFFYRDGVSFIGTDVTSGDAIKEIEDYLSNQKEPVANEMTGIFEGKNLIFIQAESLMNIAIDETLTPTLYKMMNEGILVEDFNTPLLAGSTSDTEFMANTSIIPVSDGYAVTFMYINNTYPTSLGGLFKENGYSTMAFHNNYAEYYNRNIMFKNYGYDTFFDSIELGKESECLDSEIMSVAKWILLESEHYLAYWVTYNGHQPYDLESLSEELQVYVEEIRAVYPDLDDRYVNYMAKNMDLDRCIADFIQNASDANKLDDIVFVVMGDHYAKGITETVDLQAWSNQIGVEPDGWLFNTPCFFYNSATEASTITKVGTALDMIPTIMNMWNMDYDYTTTLGNDIFDESYSGFYFGNLGVYYTNDFEYNYLTNEFNLFSDITLEDAVAELDDYYTKKEVSYNILKLDYFANKQEGK